MDEIVDSTEAEVLKLWNDAAGTADQFALLEGKYVDAATGATKDFLAIVNKATNSLVVSVNDQDRQAALNLLAANPGATFIHPGVEAAEAAAVPGTKEVPVSPEAPLPQLPEEPAAEPPAAPADQSGTLTPANVPDAENVSVNIPVTEAPSEPAAPEPAPEEAAAPAEAVARADLAPAPEPVAEPAVAAAGAPADETETETPAEEAAEPVEETPAVAPEAPVDTTTPAA